MKNQVLAICLVVICAAGLAKASLTDGLVGHWSLDGNANDLSGLGNHGTVEGASLAADRFGNLNSAYSFDGYDDRIVIGDVELVSGNQMSIQAWFQSDSQIIYSRPLVSKLFAGVAYYLGGAYGAGLEMNKGEKIQFLVNYTGDSSTLTDLTVNDGLWHHVLGVYDGTLQSDNITLYIDGALQSSTTDYKENINDVDERLCIGGNDMGGPDRDFFEGIIDDVRIYNRALSQAEITELYNIPEPSTLALLGLGGLWLWRRKA